MRSATRTTSTMARTSCTRTMCAPSRTLAVTAAAVPQSRSSGGRSPSAALQERLARGAGENRPTQRGDPIELRQHVEAVLGALREAEPGIEDDGVARDAGAFSRASTASASSRATSDSDIGVHGPLVHVARTTAVVHQDDRDACVRRPHAPSVRIEQQAADVVDDRRAARARLRARPLPCRCRSRSGRHVSAASRSITGSTRRISSAAGSGSAPGRVDSPPMSMMSAPSATIRRPVRDRALEYRSAARHRRRSRA